MSSPSSVPVLSLLVWLPLVGALALLFHRGGPSRGRRALGLVASVPSLFLAALVLRGFDPAGPAYQFIELHSWVPALGLSYDVGVDGLAAALALWLALAATLSLALSKGGRDVPFLLLLESSLLGVAVARDGFLFLSFQGAAIVWVFFLIEGEDARRRWLGYQLAGLLFFTGFFLVCYRLALDQTGFPSAELARFRGLVVFPDEERRLFVLAGLGAWIAAPLFPFVTWVAPTLERLSSAGRALVLGGAVLVPPYALVRLALPVTPDGAASWSGALALLALASLGFAGLAPRRLGLAPCVAGLQGLLLAGLVAPQLEGVPRELRLVGLGVALAALTLYGASRKPGALPERSHAAGALLALVVLGLVAWPLGWASLAPVASGSRYIGVAIGLAAALAALRVVRLTAAVAPGRRALLALAALALWVALLVAPREWTAHLHPAAAPAAEAEGAAEEDP